MQNIIKFGVLFLLVSVVLSGLGASITIIFDLFGSSISYVTTGNIGIVLTSIVSWLGWLFDMLFIGSNDIYYTYYGGVEIGSISWVLTFVRVIVGLIVAILLFKLIIDKE